MVGRVVYIENKESIYYLKWGVVQDFDGEYYHVAILNDKQCVPIFTKDELYIPEKEDLNYE